MDDSEILGSTMSASNLQLEQMASFLPGHALITFESVLKPFGVKIEQIVGKKIQIEPPNDEELFELMIKNDSFKRLLNSTLVILCDKYKKQKQKDEVGALTILNLIKNSLFKLNNDYNEVDSENIEYFKEEVIRLESKSISVKNIITRMIENLNKFRENITDIGLFEYATNIYYESRDDITYLSKQNTELSKKIIILKKCVQEK